MSDRPPSEITSNRQTPPAHVRRMQTVMGHLLRVGLLVAVAVVLVGGGAYLVNLGDLPAHYGTFTGTPTALRSIPGILHSAAQLHELGLIQLGLLILIFTPVARVAFSVAVFAAERDRLYVVLTLVVLAILALGLSGRGP